MSKKALKTPLRYPGGKSRACTKMGQFFPDFSKYKEYREPFIGGGSVAIHITKNYPKLKIWVNDLYEPLVNFWQVLQADGKALTDAILEQKIRHPDRETAKKLFTESKELINDHECSSIDRATAFYIVNKCSFSGLTEASSFSEQASDSNFSLRGIEKLPEYSALIKKWRITNESYETLMFNELRSKNNGVFMYLDPPYDIKDNLYGNKGSLHRGFDHDRFAKQCCIMSTDMMVSYNSDQLILERFNGWAAAEYDLTYTMRSVGKYMKDQKSRKELLLLNYKPKPRAKIKFSYGECHNYDKLSKAGLTT